MTYNKILLGMVLTALLVASCKETDIEFDQEKYDAGLKASFPVQNVDPTHTWATVGTGQANIQLSGDYGTTYDVGIYLENPIRSEHATLLYEGKVNGSGFINATFSYPSADTLLYIGIYDQDGRGVAEAVKIENGSIEANIGIGVSNAGSNRAQRRSSTFDIWGTKYYTDASNYQISDKTFWKNHLMNYDTYEGYYDLSEVSSEYYTKLCYGINNEMNNGNVPLYGDGKHFIVPAGKTVTGSTFNWNDGGGSDHVIVVKGTLTITGDNKFDNGKSLIVENGGKLVINSNNFEFSNSSVLINYGTIEINGTTITFSNTPSISRSTDNDSKKNTFKNAFYNGGTIKEASSTSQSMLKFSGYQVCLVNEGTIDLHCIQNGSDMTLVNLGRLTLATSHKGATKLTDASNEGNHMSLVNACNATINLAGINRYVGCDGSLLQCSTGINSNIGKFMFGDKAIVTCGNFYSNGTTLHASTDAGEYGILKVTGNWDEQNAGMNNTEGYVYCDIAQIVGKGGTDSWQKSTCESKILKHTISEGSAPNSITIPTDPDGCSTVGFNPNGNNGGDKVESTPLSLRYCFEDNFPSPGDYDFNDLVLTVTPTVSGKVLTIDVSLDAVGASNCLAAAIRVVGAGAAEAAVETGFAKPRSNFGTYYNVTTNEDFVTKGSDKVIVLFKDAHWAMNPTEDGIYSGSPKRIFYNTVKDRNSAKGQTIAKKTARYTLTFATEQQAINAATQEHFDVFIVNPSRFEIHTVQNGFKLANVLVDRQNVSAYNQAYGDNMPWAIMLPSSDISPFKYPVEWTPIGGTQGYVTQEVAYEFEDASFADWATNSASANDWYKHPVVGRVYEE